MARTRISTTVDAELLEKARQIGDRPNDAQLIDAALRALLNELRRAEIDHRYAAAYAAHPVDEPDAWGDLASFSERAAAS